MLLRSYGIVIKFCSCFCSVITVICILYSSKYKYKCAQCNPNLRPPIRLLRWSSTRFKKTKRNIPNIYFELLMLMLVLWSWLKVSFWHLVGVLQYLMMSSDVRQRLVQQIREWNINRLDLFALSEPNQVPDQNNLPDVRPYQMMLRR